MKQEMDIGAFFAHTWARYSLLTPDAFAIRELFSMHGEVVLNDHVAYRTFNIPEMGRTALGNFFEQYGYVRAPNELFFPEKKLVASYYLPPAGKLLPRVFVSELILEEVSAELRRWILEFTAPCVLSLRTNKITSETFLHPNWNPVSFADYERFHKESEYAAWVAAFGLQCNHHTVSVNAFSHLGSLQEVNALLEARNFVLNDIGGKIKGTPAQLLEQSSTMAKRVPVRFSDGMYEIPTCYYEFALRYPHPTTGELFQGFIPESANNIFSSTSLLGDQVAK